MSREVEKKIISNLIVVIEVLLFPFYRCPSEKCREMESIVAGGCAGLCTDLVLYPVDTLKTRLQSSQGFAKSGGFRGVYKGLSAALIGSVPSAGLFFFGYETTKKYVPQTTTGICCAAAAGESVSCLVRVPLDTVKQRMQAGQHASQALGAVRGGLSRCYAGIPATLRRDIPFAVLQMSLFEKLSQKDVPSVVAGAIAGGVSGFVTTPLDVVRTRTLLGETASIQSVFLEGGLTKLFTGATLRVAWISAGGAIFFSSYRVAQRAFGQTFQ